jgi:capsular polysaccharide export protein
VNGYSRLPSSAERYLEAARDLSEPSHVEIGPSLRPLFGECVRHYTAAMLLKPFFPFYRTHRAHHPIREGWQWLLRVLQLPLQKRRAHRFEVDLLASKRPYFLACFQVSVDSQVTCHSPFSGMPEFISHTIDSFARHAPADALLVFKHHPQDHGGFRYQDQIARQSAASGVAGRCLYIDGGQLPRLIKGSSGVVLVNSTVGTSALFHGKPTIALGKSVYNFAGLTCQEGLDAFWTNPNPPDKNVFKAFRRYLLNHVLVNGGYYTPEARTRLLSGVLPRLESAVGPVAVQVLAVSPKVGRDNSGSTILSKRQHGKPSPVPPDLQAIAEAQSFGPAQKAGEAA